MTSKFPFTNGKSGAANASFLGVLHQEEHKVTPIGK